MSSKYKKQRKVYKLDRATTPFFVYCLYYTDSKENIEYNEQNVFYIGKGIWREFDCNRRENRHIEEAYGKKQWDYHKSRKIRQLETDGYLILSKILEGTETEDKAYGAEIKWYNYFLNKGIPLTNMVACGPNAVGSGNGHPSYDSNIRLQSKEIKRLYEEELWTIQRICRFYKKSNGLIKKILAHEGVEFRQKNIRSPLWLKKNEIVDLYNSGMSLNELSHKYCNNNSHVAFFAKMLRSEGINVLSAGQRRRATAWKEIDVVVALYEKGYSMKYISDKYGCDSSVISEILSQNKVKKRSISHQNNLNKQRIYET